MLQGKKILITAGPTYERIDPVRFIGNHSSGKMGFSIAEEAANRGAKVILISGPTALPRPAGVEFVPVISTQDMLDAVLKYFRGKFSQSPANDSALGCILYSFLFRYAILSVEF